MIAKLLSDTFNSLTPHARYEVLYEICSCSTIIGWIDIGIGKVTISPYWVLQLYDKSHRLATQFSKDGAMHYSIWCYPFAKIKEESGKGSGYTRVYLIPWRTVSSRIFGVYLCRTIISTLRIWRIDWRLKKGNWIVKTGSNQLALWAPLSSWTLSACNLRVVGAANNFPFFSQR